MVLEGKLPKERGSWLVSGRRTYYDLVAERFTDSDLPSFEDLQGKLLLNLGGGRTLSLLSLLSREQTDATFDIEEEAAKGAVETRARNDLYAATLAVPLGKSGLARTIGAFYTNTDSFDFDGSFREQDAAGERPGRRRPTAPRASWSPGRRGSRTRACARR